MWTIDNISPIVKNGLGSYEISVINQDTQQSVLVQLPFMKLDRSVIINSVIRSRYQQDAVEAIINNHFINIAEWIDKKFAGSTDSFEDPEYEELQAWRAESKRLADEILAAINN